LSVFLEEKKGPAKTGGGGVEGVRFRPFCQGKQFPNAGGKKGCLLLRIEVRKRANSNLVEKRKREKNGLTSSLVLEEKKKESAEAQSQRVRKKREVFLLSSRTEKGREEEVILKKKVKMLFL